MEIRNKIPVKGNVIVVIRDAESGIVKDIEHVGNMVVTAAKNSIAQALSGVTSNNKGIITYCAVGTGTTAPALADTQLQTELFRKLVSVRGYVNNTAVFQTFYNTTEANGTIREAGLFGDDASDTTNSGTLFARVALNRTKSSSDTLTLYWYLTIG